MTQHLCSSAEVCISGTLLSALLKGKELLSVRSLGCDSEHQSLSSQTPENLKCRLDIQTSISVIVTFFGYSNWGEERKKRETGRGIGKGREGEGDHKQALNKNRGWL